MFFYLEDISVKLHILEGYLFVGVNFVKIALSSVIQFN